MVQKIYEGVTMILKNLPVVILLFLTVFNGCTYQTYVAKVYNPEKQYPVDTIRIDSPSKIQLKNGELIYFPLGFSLFNDSIKSFKNKIALTDISAIVNYENNTNGFRYFASGMHFLFGTLLTSAAIYCLACPKCCFGSCPTIYTFDGEKYNLEAELFSECISKQLEDSDLDMLKEKIPENRLFKLKITDEALETHYINKFNLLSVIHSKGTDLFPTINDSFLVMHKYIAPEKVTNKKGEDITCLLNSDDMNYYRSPSEMVDELKQGPVYDHLDLNIHVQKAGKPVRMVMKYRNTLLSTILLYDVVLASQGINAVSWTEKMNNNKEYAEIFNYVYKSFSGIKLLYLKNNQWIEAGKFKDSGPLNWKYIAAEIPSDNNELKIRLEFIPDNFMIDYIAFDTTSADDDLQFNCLNPVSITDFQGNERNDVQEFIQKNDSLYLVTNPGDSYSLEYNIPAQKDKVQTLFIKSGGYYNEWIREQWITQKNKDYSFNLYDINGTLRQLAESWKENREIIESEFFKSKIDLRRN